MYKHYERNEHYEYLSKNNEHFGNLDFFRFLKICKRHERYEHYDQYIKTKIFKTIGISIIF